MAVSDRYYKVYCEKCKKICSCKCLFQGSSRINGFISGNGNEAAASITDNLVRLKCNCCDSIFTKTQEEFRKIVSDNLNVR